jgi:acyl carrier protein
MDPVEGMTPEVLERVRGVAADVFMLPEEQLRPESSPENVECWDSVQHLNLVLALEQQFDLQFEPEEMDQMKSIGQIAALLSGKAGNKLG